MSDLELGLAHVPLESGSVPKSSHSGIVLRGDAHIDAPTCGCGARMSALRQPNSQSVIFECRNTRGDEECGMEAIVCLHENGTHRRTFWSISCPENMPLTAYARRQLGVDAKHYGFAAE
jgi:hypothetical protein